jgi:UDP:flavonoid glycosyltransferase YjiC (YdhE family)
MPPKTLFVVNGLGLGNSTRCFAIIEHLYNEGVEVHVLTSGNGAFFFSNKREVASVTETEALHYGKGADGKLSILKTLAGLRGVYRAYRNKTRQLSELLDQVDPAIVVADSDYFIFPVTRRKIPLVGINNSDVVVSEYFAKNGKPASIRSQFWCIEFMDYCFHKRFCDLVLSPAPWPITTRNPKFQRTGLIVRNQLLKAIRQGRQSGGNKTPEDTLVVFMLSGSTFSANIDFSTIHLPCRIEVVGRQGESRGNIRFLGKMQDNIHKLLEADILVVNAGFSAISEAMVLAKPTLVLPVGNHAEQYLNAEMMADSGLGQIVSEQNVLKTLQTLLLTGPPAAGPSVRRAVNCNGAREAASTILNLIGRNTSNTRIAA